MKFRSLKVCRGCSQLASSENPVKIGNQYYEVTAHISEVRWKCKLTTHASIQEAYEIIEPPDNCLRLMEQSVMVQRENEIG